MQDLPGRIAAGKSCIVRRSCSWYDVAVNKRRVLIICTGNSARSQMAEALLRHEADDLYEVFSAGANPGPVRPEAVTVMREISVDISAQRSKPVTMFQGQQFDFIITVCDKAREECPILSGEAERLHWPFEDPASFIEVDKERLRPFEDRVTESFAVMVFLGEGAYGSEERT